MNKKAISTIVATVLIVLITVAAVTILWAAVSPLIDRNLEGSTACFDAQNALSVSTNKEFTCYNSQVNDKYTNISIRVERGANSDTLKGYEIIVENDGTSLDSYIVNDTDTDTKLPTENGAKKVVITNASLGSGIGDGAFGEVKVSIAPRIMVDGEVTSCEATKAIEVMAC